jgi:hypothetical protein
MVSPEEITHILLRGRIERHHYAVPIGHDHELGSIVYSMPSTAAPARGLMERRWLARLREHEHDLP